MPKKKIKLEDIKVQTFISKTEAETIFGASIRTFDTHDSPNIPYTDWGTHKVGNNNACDLDPDQTLNDHTPKMSGLDFTKKWWCDNLTQPFPWNPCQIPAEAQTITGDKDPKSLCDPNPNCSQRLSGIANYRTCIQTSPQMCPQQKTGDFLCARDSLRNGNPIIAGVGTGLGTGAGPGPATETNWTGPVTGNPGPGGWPGPGPGGPGPGPGGPGPGPGGPGPGPGPGGPGPGPGGPGGPGPGGPGPGGPGGGGPMCGDTIIAFYTGDNTTVLGDPRNLPETYV